MSPRCCWTATPISCSQHVFWSGMMGAIWRDPTLALLAVKGGRERKSLQMRNGSKKLWDVRLSVTWEKNWINMLSVLKVWQRKVPYTKSFHWSFCTQICTLQLTCFRDERKDFHACTPESSVSDSRLANEHSHYCLKQCLVSEWEPNPSEKDGCGRDSCIAWG